MVVREEHETREDGVKLYRTIDAKVDENGNPLRDEKGKLISTGFKIQKVVVTWNDKRYKKDAPYNEAIDVEGAPYEYVETDIPIDSPAEEMQKSSENEADSTSVQT